MADKETPNPDTLAAVIAQSPMDQEEEDREFESAFNRVRDGAEKTVTKAADGEKGEPEGDAPDKPEGENKDDGKDDAGNGDNKPATDQPAAAKGDDKGDNKGDDKGDDGKAKPADAGGLDAINAAIRSIHAKFGTLNSKVSTLIEASKTATERKGEDSPTAKAIREAMGDGEKMAALRKEYPDWAGAFDESLNTMVTAIAKQIPDQAALTDAIVEQVTMNMSRPTWRKDVRDPAFKAWLEANKDDDEIAALAESEFAGDALDLLARYDQSKQQQPGSGGKSEPNATAEKPAGGSDKSKDQGGEKKLDSLKRAAAPTRGARPAQPKPSDEEDFQTGFNRRRAQ